MTAGSAWASGLSTTSAGVSALDHTPPGHLRRRQCTVETHQRLDRRHHARLVRHERRQGAEREGALDDAQAAVEEHGRRACREQERR